MTETIKVDVEEALAKKFRKRAMELYGYKRGAIKKALEEVMRRFSASGEADWGSLKGAIKRDISSVELQHSAWVRTIDSNRHKHYS